MGQVDSAKGNALSARVRPHDRWAFQMTVKFQVFISSTFADLKDERKAITEAVLDLDQIPSGMELFPASDQTQFDYISKVIDECDYYVLVIGGRYGSLDASGLSYTEKEFDYAVSKKKIVLSFLHEDASKIAASKVDRDQILIDKLESFRKKASTERLVKFWLDKGDLKTKVTAALAIAMTRFPGVGWVRGDTVASADLLQQLNDVRTENEKLKAQATESRPVINIEDIAGKEEAFSLHYKYRSSYNDQERNANYNGSWIDIFKMIAPNCLAAKSSSLVESFISKSLKDKRGHYTVSISDDVLTNIILQLDALGLIRYYVAKTTEGINHEFLQITDQGKALLYDSFIVRTAAENAAPADK